ncbi:13298_t:CDS:2, partial [Rhizophagus irregularis]
MNDDNIFPTAQTSNTNNNYSDHQPTSNGNTVSTSISQYYTSPFDIPGFKIIIVPTFPQQDNTYSDYSSL